MSDWGSARVLENTLTCAPGRFDSGVSKGCAVSGQILAFFRKKLPHMIWVPGTSWKSGRKWKISVGLLNSIHWFSKKRIGDLKIARLIWLLEMLSYFPRYIIYTKELLESVRVWNIHIHRILLKIYSLNVKKKYPFHVITLSFTVFCLLSNLLF